MSGRRKEDIVLLNQYSLQKESGMTALFLIVSPLISTVLFSPFFTFCSDISVEGIGGIKWRM